MSQPALQCFDSSLYDFLEKDFEIIKLNDTCSFSEGPVWSKEGFFLFSDMPQNAVYKIGRGLSKSLYLQPSGFTGSDDSFLSDQPGSNGLAFDKDGNLLLCQHGNGAIGMYDGSVLQPVINQYNGNRFNSPNDLVVHSNGSIFFSDPPYGLKDQQLLPDRCQPAAGIYCWRNDDVHLFNDRFQYPNGVCLSPDERYLYCCSTKSFEKMVMMYDAESLQFIRILAEENSDGMKCDAFGNLYLCAKDGVVILNSVGKRLGIILLQTQPANIAWGGSEGRDLLVTARQNIFLIPDLQKKL